MKDYGISLKRQGHIAVITLDRPAKQNAFDQHMWDCMDKVVAEKDLPQKFFAITSIFDHRENSFPDQIPHPPYTSAQIISSFFYGKEAFGKRDINPLFPLIYMNFIIFYGHVAKV